MLSDKELIIKAKFLEYGWVEYANSPQYIRYFNNDYAYDLKFENNNIIFFNNNSRTVMSNIDNLSVDINVIVSDVHNRVFQFNKKAP